MVHGQVDGYVEHLARTEMTLALLSDTGVGRVVQRIAKRREPLLARAAARARCGRAAVGALDKGLRLKV